VQSGFRCQCTSPSFLPVSEAFGFLFGQFRSINIRKRWQQQKTVDRYSQNHQFTILPLGVAVENSDSGRHRQSSSIFLQNTVQFGQRFAKTQKGRPIHFMARSVQIDARAYLPVIWGLIAETEAVWLFAARQWVGWADVDRRTSPQRRNSAPFRAVHTSTAALPLWPPVLRLNKKMWRYCWHMSVLPPIQCIHSRLRVH